MTGIHLMDEGTPEQAYRDGGASAVEVIRSLGEKFVPAFQNPHERAKIRGRALKDHSCHWDKRGDLSEAFLRGFDDTIRRRMDETK